MVGGESACGCLGWGRGYKWCVGNLGGTVCVWGGGGGEEVEGDANIYHYAHANN